MGNTTRLFLIEREIQRLESKELTPEIEQKIAELDEEANAIQCAINKHKEEIERLEEAKQAAYVQKEIEQRRREAIRVCEYQDRVKAFYAKHRTARKILMLLEEFGHEFEKDYDIMGTTVKSHVAKDNQNRIHFCGSEEAAIKTVQKLIYWRIRSKLLRYTTLEDIYRIEDIISRIDNMET